MTTVVGVHVAAHAPTVPAGVVATTGAPAIVMAAEAVYAASGAPVTVSA